MKTLRPALKRARIEIIPMIDTIFFLLVFFMIASLSMVRMRTVEPALPRPITVGHAAASGTAANPQVVLTMTSRREYFVGRNRTEVGNIQSDLDQYASSHPGCTVVLNLSPKLSTQDLLDVLDTVGRVRGADGRPVTELIATQQSSATSTGARGQ